MNNAQKLRKLYKKTQSEISEIIEFAKPLYAAFEHEKLRLPEDKLRMLAQYYNVSIDYLVEGMHFNAVWQE